MEAERRAGRFDDGSVRRVHRTVRAGTAAESARLLAEFVTEVHNSPLPDRRPTATSPLTRRSNGS